MAIVTGLLGLLGLHTKMRKLLNYEYDMCCRDQQDCSRCCVRFGLASGLVFSRDIVAFPNRQSLHHGWTSRDGSPFLGHSPFTIFLLLLFSSLLSLSLSLATSTHTASIRQQHDKARETARSIVRKSMKHSEQKLQ